jgi:CMP-N-acetylneuraminic acid synthetase
MKQVEDICFIVQARLNSERVPQKMLRPFAGTTLTDIVLSKLVSAQSIPNSQIYLSVYEEELKEIGRKYPINIYDRSYESANIDSGIQVLFEWWDKLPYKYIVMISGCNPLLEVSTIDRFVESYLDSAHTGLFSVIEKKNYFWNTEGDMLNSWPDGQDLLNTKAVEATYEAAHCLYASRMSDIGEGKWVGSWQKKNDPELFQVTEYESFDIDYEWQFKAAERLFA